MNSKGLTRIKADYGIIADPKKSVHRNLLEYVNAIPAPLFDPNFPKLANCTFHDLCTVLKPPFGTDELLGLGLKFCIQEKVAKNEISNGIKKLGNSLQVAWNLALPEINNNTEPRTYNPKIYIPSEWIPEITSDEINIRLADFDSLLKQSIDANKNKRPQREYFNLHSNQRKLILVLKNHDDFIICETDKGLGACLIERVLYYKRVDSDHLSNVHVYTQVTKKEFNILRQNAEKAIKKFILKIRTYIPAHEFTYLHRAYLADNKPLKRIAQFYILPKIHKTPWATRPVVSDSGSVTSYLSKWVDVQLSYIARKYILTFTQDSEDLRRTLQKMSPLPAGAFLFTTDANAMYTNIDPDHAISELQKWLPTLPGSNPYHTTHLLEALNLVMKNNLFQFANTYWKQISGVAMGTPSACQLATIYYGIHENNFLIPKYKNNIPYIKRFIDDMLGVFLVYNNSDLQKWEEFKTDLPYGNLTWDTEKLSRSVDFLDLTIMVSETGSISTKTFQKKMNLYLYIPPHSAHSPKLFRSIIYSTIRRYWLQNSKWSDFKFIADQFFNRLTNRGHQPHLLSPTFKSSFELLSQQIPFESTDTMDPAPQKSKLITKTKTNSKDTKTFYFHLEYHPKGISNREIQTAYNSAFNSEKTFQRKNRDGTTSDYTSPGLTEGIPGISRNLTVTADRMIIALKRPKNLRDELNPSTFYTPTGTSFLKKVKR